MHPAKGAQKDVDARWTKKHGQNHSGYQNHISVDRRHKLVRRYAVTDAAVHDSQVIDELIDHPNTSQGVWADRAYRSAAIERMLRGSGAAEQSHPSPGGSQPTVDGP